jgi:alpha-D-ribose 1-methylphosphonate 5-triphosphate diphosphatase
VLMLEGAIETADVHMADSVIVETKPANAAEIDCRGYHVLPGIIDVHGGAFEAELYPRLSIDIAFGIAMRSVDRQLLVNGLTTAFQGHSLSWESCVRSLHSARLFMTGIVALRPALAADHRVQRSHNRYA